MYITETPVLSCTLSIYSVSGLFIPCYSHLVGEGNLLALGRLEGKQARYFGGSATLRIVFF